MMDGRVDAAGNGVVRFPHDRSRAGDQRNSRQDVERLGGDGAVHFPHPGGGFLNGDLGRVAVAGFGRSFLAHGRGAFG